LLLIRLLLLINWFYWTNLSSILDSGLFVSREGRLLPILVSLYQGREDCSRGKILRSREGRLLQGMKINDCSGEDCSLRFEGRSREGRGRKIASNLREGRLLQGRKIAPGNIASKEGRLLQGRLLPEIRLLL